MTVVVLEMKKMRMMTANDKCSNLILSYYGYSYYEKLLVILSIVSVMYPSLVFQRMEKGTRLKRLHFISNVTTALKFLEARKVGTLWKRPGKPICIVLSQH